MKGTIRVEALSGGDYSKSKQAADISLESPSYIDDFKHMQNHRTNGSTRYTESKRRFHTRQTRFRRRLCAQGSSVIIWNVMNACTEKGEPRILVAQRKPTRPRGPLLPFVQSFLEERTFQVQMGNERHPSKVYDIGVPQGRVLTPTLFGAVMVNLAFAVK